MPLPYVLKRMRWRALEAFGRRNMPLNPSEPIVSFTFDDFPQSAFRIGGSILKSYGVYGTYYASMGLMNRTNNLGRLFDESDIEGLLRDGHELGSHTLDHNSLRLISLGDFKSNVLKGIEAIEQLAGKELPRLFSYPYGRASFITKRSLGRLFLCCRGIIPGINKSPVDLNLLRGNSLYSCCADLEAIGRLFDANQEYKGWLIFYTHDISEAPSPFGCTPGYLRRVIEMALRFKSRILPVGQAAIAASEEMGNV